MDICQSVKELVVLIVTEPETVTVECTKNEQGNTSIVIRVSPNDVRRVVGNSGRVFRSIRTIVQASLSDYNAQITVDMLPSLPA